MSDPLRFLALGDSYTIGEGVEAPQRWSSQLVLKLRSRGLDLLDAQIVATTGWTTDELDAGMDAAALAPEFNLVSLMIGVNDQYRGRDADSFRAGFTRLLQRALALAGDRAARVIALSIPDWGVTPFAREQNADAAKVAAAIDAFNAIVAEVCEDHAVAFIDVTGLSRGTGRDLLVADGLHPSAAQYALWSAQIEPFAWRALGG